MRVAVLKGGRSLEREISLRSGANAEAALRRLGHEVLEIDVDQHLVRRLRAERPDAAFIALHGKGGEDGTVQELLEILEIPYTGPGVLACERATDKVVAKAHFAAAGVDTPRAYAFSQDAFRELGAGDAIPAIVERLGLPLVVKPAKQGSALGITVAHEPHDVPAALMSALSYDERCSSSASSRGVSSPSRSSGPPSPGRSRWSRRSRAIASSTTSSRATRPG